MFWGKKEEQQPQSSPSQPATPDFKRVLVIGDNAAGKSLLTSLLCSASTSPNGLPQLPETRLAPTIGCRTDAMVLPSAQHGIATGRQRAVEFIEVGGGRNLMPAARLSCYNNIDGVIFVYHKRNPSSALSLYQWFDELKQIGVVGGRPVDDYSTPAVNSPPRGTYSVGGPMINSTDSALGGGSGLITPKPFILVGTSLPKSSRTYAEDVDGWLDLIANPANTVNIAGDKAPVVAAIAQKVIDILFIWQRILLLTMSLVLFGLNQQVVPFKLPTVKRALDTIRNDDGCHAEVESCPLDSGVNFANNSEEIRHFLSALWM